LARISASFPDGGGPVGGAWAGGLPPAFFSSSTVARVFLGSALAFASQLAQHRKTVSPPTVVLKGAPIEPRRFLRRIGQNFWASASRRSAGPSLASSARALRSRASSSSGVDGRTATAAPPLPPLPPK